jgi:hypothetical protein
MRWKNPATDYLEKLIGQFEEGQGDPLRTYIRLYEIEKMAAEFRKQVIDEAIDKREQIGGKTYEQDGYEIAVQSRLTWSYKDDEEHERLQALVKNRQALMKKAYHSARKGVGFADENGVIVEPAEPKTSTTIVLKAK